MLPTPLTLIPTMVLDGLFLFMAITALDGNQMFERALLLITEQVKIAVNSQTLSTPASTLEYTATESVLWEAFHTWCPRTCGWVLAQNAVGFTP